MKKIVWIVWFSCFWLVIALTRFRLCTVKMERRLHPSWGYYLLEETSSSFRWVWDFDVASDQLSAQPRQSFKQWEENFTQHWITFVRFWHWLGLNSGNQRVSSFNPWRQRFHCTNETLHGIITLKRLIRFWNLSANKFFLLYCSFIKNLYIQRENYVNYFEKSLRNSRYTEKIFEFNLFLFGVNLVYYPGEIYFENSLKYYLKSSFNKLRKALHSILRRDFIVFPKSQNHLGRVLGIIFRGM
jgi:hypothetical protein